MKKVLIAGASGFVGTALKNFLTAQGYLVSTLVRRLPKNESEIFWNPARQEVELEKLEGFNFIINLCGENIARQRWTQNYKERLLESRLHPTQLLAQNIHRLKLPPQKFLNASAIGIYGSTREAQPPLDESSPLGNEFLAQVCKAWEATAMIAKSEHTQVNTLRFATVLDKSGGMIRKLAPSFKFGLGACLGNGHQRFSWIALEDALAAIQFLLENNIDGPVNISSPAVVTNLQFSKVLARSYNRISFLKIPEFILKLIFGKEFTEQLLLADLAVKPSKLLGAGFKFKLANLEACLS